MTDRIPVAEPELERQGRDLGRPGWRFLLVAALIAVAGIVLVAFTERWQTIGVILLALAGPPGVVGLGLLLSSLITRWSARHRSYA